MKNSTKSSKIGQFKRYFNKIITIIKMPEMGVLPGQLAFYMLLSLVPLILLACYVAFIFDLDYNKIVFMIDQFVPGGINSIVPSLSIGTLSVPIIILYGWMLYIASNGCNTVILISNDIYGIRQSKWIRRRIKALFMTFMIVIFVIGLLLLNAYQGRFENWINTLANGPMILKYIKWLEYPLMFMILALFLKAFYNFAPDRMRKKTNINVGTVFTSCAWILITTVYKIIATHMFSYEMIYGGLAKVALLMVWLYFISFSFVIGLALNYGDELEENK
ncbi:MAG: YihY/virulence factor BrkB family protein [Bacilli bacterium]|nr:YihY/virulence factor BrkB family protein [Bacilli bacterium]